MKQEDLVGKKFGKLIVIEYAGKYSKARCSLWKCQCECGNIAYVARMHLGRGTNSCGCSRLLDKKKVIGKKFGKLTVVDFAGIKKRNSLWKCRCECGNIAYVSMSNLRKAKSCGCSWRTRGETNHRWKGHKEISGRLWLVIQNHAKSRKLDFEITIEYIWDLFIKQNRKCAISGLHIDVINGGSNRNGCYCTGSLDRIDSSKGYVVGNVQWVHKLVNRMKMDLPENIFLKLCVLIGEKQSELFFTKDEIDQLNKIILRKHKSLNSKRTVKKSRNTKCV